MRESNPGRHRLSPKLERARGVMRGDPDHILEFTFRDADGAIYATGRTLIPAEWQAVQLDRKEVDFEG